MRILATCFVLVLVGSWTASGCAPIAIEVAKVVAKEAGKGVAKEAGKAVAKEAGKGAAKGAGKAVVKGVGKGAEKEAGKTATSAATTEEATTIPTPTATTGSQATLEVSPSPQTVTATPTPSPYVVLRVTAQEIIDDYNEGRSEADEKYKGVVLEVFGEVARVRQDEEHYIVFNIRGGPDNVRCNLAPGQVDIWARLNKGDRVVVVGTGVGKNIGRWGDFNLDSCILNPSSG